ncbi:hypothetical protein TNCV_4073571 [Trichonephila clavipes]|uniref:Uncharacterized protein n=1 Tax=Trichonephila clavipes TaxID=2585209 RepID=A0A8X6W8X1_TRICX|nr:hypothetical protein TNCV_4073571 [Trichonephila clavipes]
MDEPVLVDVESVTTENVRVKSIGALSPCISLCRGDRRSSVPRTQNELKSALHSRPGALKTVRVTEPMQVNMSRQVVGVVWFKLILVKTLHSKAIYGILVTELKVLNLNLMTRTIVELAPFLQTSSPRQ